MKKLCVLVALTLAVTSAVEAKDYPIKRPANVYGDVYFDMAPKRMFDFIVGFIIRKGLSRRLERVARKISLNQPPEKERLLIMNRLNAR